MSLDFIGLDSNQNKKVFRVAGATLGQGVPLGTWCSFEKDVAPSSNWLVAGSSFNANTYPALALYLGTNQVPYRYDHNRLNEENQWAMLQNATSLATAVQMPYDGVISFVTNYDKYKGIYVYDATKTTLLDFVGMNSNEKTGVAGFTCFNKGDYVYLEGTSPLTQDICHLRFYTHPLFIKATSIASDTDQQAILAQIQAYNTYSTDETLTGKTLVINGVEKPVYKRLVNYSTPLSINGSGSDQIISGLLTGNEDLIVKTSLIGWRDSSHNQPLYQGFTSWRNNTNYNNLNAVIPITCYVTSFIFEYTKTTD